MAVLDCWHQGSKDFFLEDCETSHNNWRGAWAGFYRGSPCGIKIMRCDDVSLKRHKALRNCATGVWIDEDNHDVVVRDALIAGNYRGLHIEATRGLVLIDNCIIIDNRREPTPHQWRWAFGSGLVITHASHVTIEHCTLSGNDTAQIGVRDDRETRHLVDKLAGTESEEFSSNLHWFNNTMIASAHGGLLRLPDSEFDHGRFWRSMSADNNYYLGFDKGQEFLLSRNFTETPRQLRNTVVCTVA